MLKRFAPIFALALAAPALSARADIIRYTFGGSLDKIVENDGGMIAGASNGAAFTGEFWFERSTPDNDPLSRNGEYVLDRDAGIQVTIAGVTYSFTGESVFIRVRNFIDADFFGFSGQEFGDVQSGGYRFWDFGLQLTDADASAFPDDDLPTSMTAGDFNSRRFRMIGESRSNANNDFWIEGNITSLDRYVPSPPPPPDDPVRGDFNGDGKADLVFRNTTTGRNALWRMDGATRQSSAQLSPLGTQAWKMRGLYDFDGDDYTDIIWRNASNGNIAVWRMDGDTFLESVTLPSLRGAHWLMAGVGDFDKDGNMDILWRNATNGSNRVWRLDGTNLVENAAIAGHANQNWRIAGVDDFDGSGGADILWRHRISGDIVIWIMNSLARQTVVSLGQVLPSQWEVAGVGDYDGDGALDIAFYNPATGAGKMAFLAGEDDLRVTSIIDLSGLVTRGWLGAAHEIGPGTPAALAALPAAQGAAAAGGFGGFTAMRASAAIPEPASAITLLLGAALGLARRRR